MNMTAVTAAVIGSPCRVRAMAAAPAASKSSDPPSSRAIPPQANWSSPRRLPWERTRLFYDDACVDNGVAHAGNRHPEADPRAVPDAGGNTQVDRLARRLVADTGAVGAPVVPDLTSAAAAGTGAAHGHLERNRGAPER